MRAWLVLLVVVPLAGCNATPDACAELPAQRGVVEAISGRDATVRLDDGQPAVLHLSAVFVSEAGACTQMGPEAILVGDTLAFDVDAWAESYPMQGWPETTVVLR
ncbi:MAG: hypothetical protein WC876_02555 [Candidatus Thermoplasmatota archaeon]|jgi:hypothetical protein